MLCFVRCTCVLHPPPKTKKNKKTHPQTHPNLTTHPKIERRQGYRDAVLIEADLLFGMCFGSERFRPYLGKLFLASAMGG